MNSPTNLELARPAWRLAAGVINFLAVGFIAAITRLAAQPLGENRIRMIVLLGVTVFWLACVLRGKSLGGSFCLLEIRRADFSTLAFPTQLLRTLPFYLLALIGFLPLSVFPVSVAIIQALVFLSLTAVLIVDVAFLLITRRSLVDRWLKIKVLRLNLPERVRPRIFGIRIS